MQNKHKWTSYASWNLSIRVESISQPRKDCKQCHAAFTFPQASHQCLQLVSSLEKWSPEKSILQNNKLDTRHGTITGFKVYRGFKKVSFKTTKMFRYTVSAVCTVFLWVIKDGKCRTPSVVCSEERTSHSAPPPPVSESQLCVWWPKEMNPCNFSTVEKHEVCHMENVPVT